MWAGKLIPSGSLFASDKLARDLPPYDRPGRGNCVRNDTENDNPVILCFIWRFVKEGLAAGQIPGQIKRAHPARCRESK